MSGGQIAVSGGGFERRELAAVLGDDADEILGRAMMYSVGEVLVPLDWLQQELRVRNVPEQIIPDAPTPHSAYKRAMSRLVTSNPDLGSDRTDQYWVEVDGDSRKVELELKDGQRNEKHLHGSIFLPEEDIGVEGGQWIDHELGRFDYVTELQAFHAERSDDCPEALEGVWGAMEARGERMWDEMKNHVTGQDLRNMIYLEMVYDSPADWPTIISLRDAVYFIPEGPLTDVIDALADVFDEINHQFKDGSTTVAIRTLPVVDDAERREWIRSRVEETLEDLVDDVLEDAWDALDEGDDTPEEIVETVAERLDEGDDADDWNDLLQAQLDVEAILASRATDVDEESRREIIEGVLDEADI